MNKIIKIPHKTQPVINDAGYGEGSTEAPGFQQRRLVEEGEGDKIGRVRLMESGGEWIRVIAEQRARESDGRE